MGTFHLNARYADESYHQAGAGDVADYYGDSYTTANARLSVTDQEGSWSASIYAQNLTDEIAPLEGFSQVFQSAVGRQAQRVSTPDLAALRPKPGERLTATTTFCSRRRPRATGSRATR